MKEINIIRLLKRKIISSSFFWRLRHLFQPNWVESYENKVTPAFFFSFVSENNIKSILDYGCASGSLLYDLKKKNSNILSYGIDINKKALEVCNKNFSLIPGPEFTFFFDSELNQSNLHNFFNKNEFNSFDLAIFDRVLYCLNENDLESLLGSISKISDMILIDDFQITNKLRPQGYLHRDWISTLQQYNYINILNMPTIHSTVENANARTMVFQKTSITKFK
jgi:SAM-dependent methyltransferase